MNNMVHELKSTPTATVRKMFPDAASIRQEPGRTIVFDELIEAHGHPTAIVFEGSRSANFMAR